MTPDTDRVHVDPRSGRRYALDAYGHAYWLPDPPPTRTLRVGARPRPPLLHGLAQVLLWAFAAAGALHIGRVLYLAVQ